MRRAELRRPCPCLCPSWRTPPAYESSRARGKPEAVGRIPLDRTAATRSRLYRRAMSEGRPRVAIVTGSESGIGRATAVALAEQGCDLGITWYRDEKAGEATAEEVRSLGRRAEARHLDLTQLPGAADVVDELADALGGVDVLVNDAGTGHRTPLLELDFGTWREVIGTDLDGAFLFLQRAARRMVAAGRGGRIVSVTSVHEHQPRVGAAAYCAAKGGLGLLTRVAA